MRITVTNPELGFVQEVSLNGVFNEEDFLFELKLGLEYLHLTPEGLEAITEDYKVLGVEGSLYQWERDLVQLFLRGGRLSGHFWEAKLYLEGKDLDEANAITTFMKWPLSIPSDLDHFKDFLSKLSRQFRGLFPNVYEFARHENYMEDQDNFETLAQWTDHCIALEYRSRYVFVYQGQLPPLGVIKVTYGAFPVYVFDKEIN